MLRIRKHRPNWPYRLAWLVIAVAVVLYVAVQAVIVNQTYSHRSIGSDWPLAIVAGLLDGTIAIWFVVVGACIGSFLNVVAYRLPLGRYIGGHSGCPYCQTPIDSLDNVPVLAWIQLRGRCRSCRLPISIQYPLVEFSVAMIFLSVYVSEFASGGANLPSNQLPSRGGGLLGISVTPDIVLRIVAYLFILSGLVAAALIAVKRQSVPLKLYFWTLLPLAVASMVQPKITLVPWRETLASGPVETRLNVIATMLCGAVAGIALSRLIAPLVYRGMDPRLLAGDAATRNARQFTGAMAVAGATLGWQFVVPLGWTIVVVGLVGSLAFRQFRDAAGLSDLTVWLWLGLLIFRANWNALTHLGSLVAWPPVVVQISAALALAPLCIAFNRFAAPVATSAGECDSSEAEVEVT